jgi:hypothetical protein
VAFIRLMFRRAVSQLNGSRALSVPENSSSSSTVRTMILRRCYVRARGESEKAIFKYLKIHSCAVYTVACSTAIVAKREYEGRANFLENRFLPLFHTKT